MMNPENPDVTSSVSHGNVTVRAILLGITSSIPSLTYSGGYSTGKTSMKIGIIMGVDQYSFQHS